MIGHIYCFTNLEDNKKYIGITSNLKNRMTSHKHAYSNSYFHKSIRKYGFEKFTFEILATFNGITFRELGEYERSFIDKYKKKGYELYNLTDGGEGVMGLNKPCKEETRLKKCKKIYQYSLKGDFIKEWEGIRYVGSCLKIGIGSISNALNGRIKSAGGFLWSFEKKNRVDKYKKKKPSMSEEAKEKLRERNRKNKWGTGRKNTEKTKRIWSMQRKGNQFWRFRK
jgi:group I intron endonuclease